MSVTITSGTANPPAQWNLWDPEVEFKKSACIQLAASMLYGWDPGSLTPKRIREIAKRATWLAEDLWSMQLLTSKTIPGSRLRRKKRKGKK